MRRIRSYRQPIPAPNIPYSASDETPPPEQKYEEIWVVLEEPLLEFTQKDLIFLRERGIDPFSD